MLIPKLITLGSTVCERERFWESYEAGALRALSRGLLCGRGRAVVDVMCRQ